MPVILPNVKNIRFIHSIFPPDHLVDDAGVALYDLDDLGGYVLLDVVGHGDAGIPVRVHPHGRVHGLQQRALVYAGEYEASLVQRLRPLGRRPDADRRERAPDAREEAALLGKGSGVRNHREGVHLQAVVVMEPQRLVPDDAAVEPEPARLQPLPRTGVAAVEHGHVVFLRHGVDGAEQAPEVLLRVDVLLPVGGQEDVPPLLQPEARMHVGGFNLRQVRTQHLRHRRPRHVGALLRQAAFDEIPPRVLRVAEVHVRDDVDYPPVRLLRQALVLAPVAGLHVEDGYVQALGPDDAQAGVRVPQDEHRVRLRPYHELVAPVDDVAHGRPQVVADGVHVHLRVGELQVLEEHPVEVVVVVLPGVGQQAVEVLPALGYHGRQADYLRPRADYDEQFQFSVVLERCHVRLFYGFEICVGAVRVEDLVRPHHRHEVLGVAEVDDVVRIAGQHVHGPDVLARDLELYHLVGADPALLYQAAAAHDDEELPLGVVPVLPLGHAGSRDVHAHLTAFLRTEDFGEAAPLVDVHLQREGDLLLREV